MLRRHSWLAIGIAVLLPIVAVRAQSSGGPSGAERFAIVALQVIDDVTDAPLPGVRVSILGDSTERLTDANGRAVLVARRAGRVPLVLRRLGYMPGSVMADQSASDTTRLTFAMSKVVQTLATVAVSEETAVAMKNPVAVNVELPSMASSDPCKATTPAISGKPGTTFYNRIRTVSRT